MLYRPHSVAAAARVETVVNIFFLAPEEAESDKPPPVMSLSG